MQLIIRSTGPTKETKAAIVILGILIEKQQMVSKMFERERLCCSYVICILKRKHVERIPHHDLQLQDQCLNNHRKQKLDKLQNISPYSLYRCDTPPPPSHPR